MAQTLTDVIKNQNNRLTNIETEDVDMSASIASIVKVVDGIKIRTTVTTRIHQYKLIGNFKVGDTI